MPDRNGQALLFYRSAGWLLWALLAGYLIFNRPFAQLRLGPVYIGEIVLALCLIAALTRARTAFFELLRFSWPFRLIALFFAYGTVRALLDFMDHGTLALRDGTICGYALVAFLAPALWERPDDSLAISVKRVLLPVSACAALVAAAIHCGWAPEFLSSHIKADFLALASAMAAWLFAITAIEKATDKPAAHKKAVGLAAMAAAAGLLVFALPARTLWLAIFPVLFCSGAALAYNTRRKRVLFGISVAALGLASLGLSGSLRTYLDLRREYELDKHMDLSVDEIERLQLPPEQSLAQPLPALPVSQPGQIVASSTTHPTVERLQALLDPDESRFQTQAGRLGAHAVRWRAIFWMRCWHVTLAQNSFFGSGFGNNLTQTLRPTPAWPIYVPSMKLEPPNRSPHSAHVTVLTRLGFAGLVLWLVLLLFVFCSAVGTCWRCLRSANEQSANEAMRYRRHFFAVLSLLGAWVIVVWTLSFGVILEGPFGGMWFWTLSGVLAASTITPPVPSAETTAS